MTTQWSVLNANGISSSRIIAIRRPRDATNISTYCGFTFSDKDHSKLARCNYDMRDMKIFAIDSAQCLLNLNGTRGPCRFSWGRYPDSSRMTVLLGSTEQAIAKRYFKKPSCSVSSRIALSKEKNAQFACSVSHA